jgi:hypothetical protein
MVKSRKKKCDTEKLYFNKSKTKQYYLTAGGNKVYCKPKNVKKTLNDDSESDDDDIKVHFKKRTRVRIVSDSESDSESDDDIKVHFKKRTRVRIVSDSESDSDDNVNLQNRIRLESLKIKKQEKRLKKIDKEIKKTDGSEQVEKKLERKKEKMRLLQLKQGKIDLEYYLTSSMDGFHKFRGNDDISHPWLQYLQFKLPHLFCFVNDAPFQGGALLYQFYDTPKKKATIYRESIYDLPFINTQVLDSDGKWSRYYSKMTGNEELVSNVPISGYQLKLLKKIKNEEYYFVEEEPAKGKGLHNTEKFIELIRHCNTKKVRFSIQLLRIAFAPGEYHSNAIIYDNKKKTLTRFEPHGDVSSYSSYRLNHKFQDFVIKNVDLFPGGYIAPHWICPNVGPQTRELIADYPKKEGQAGGFCAAWTQLYIHLRILNPDLTDLEVMELLNVAPRKLSIIIRNYMAAIMNYVSKNKYK